VPVEVKLATGSGVAAEWAIEADEVPLPTQTGTASPVLTLSWAEFPGQVAAQGQTGSTLHLQVAVKAGTNEGFTTIILTSQGPTNSGARTYAQWVALVQITTN
jgi:hypothetical protein